MSTFGWAILRGILGNFGTESTPVPVLYLYAAMNQSVYSESKRVHGWKANSQTPNILQAT